MKKTAKPRPPSKIAEAFRFAKEAFEAVTKIGYKLGNFAHRMDQRDTIVNRELANVREQISLLNDWRSQAVQAQQWEARALDAESKLESTPAVNPLELEVKKLDEIIGQWQDRARLAEDRLADCAKQAELLRLQWEKRARDAESKLESEPVDGATFEFWRSRSNSMEKELAQAEERIAKCAEECEKLRQSSPEEKSKVDSGKSFSEGYWHGREIADAFLQDHVRRHGDGARAIRELAGLTMNAHPSDKKIRNCWCVLTVPTGFLNSCPDCGGTGYVIKNESSLESEPVRPCWCGHSVNSHGQGGCRDCQCNGYSPKDAVEKPDHLKGCPARGKFGLVGWSFGPCNCTGLPKPPESKPLRLLVEVVPKKDEKHGTGRITYPSGISLLVSGPYEDNSAAMSVQELPPIPSIHSLFAILSSTGFSHQGMRDVLKACGLEVDC